MKNNLVDKKEMCLMIKTTNNSIRDCEYALWRRSIQTPTLSHEAES